MCFRASHPGDASLHEASSCNHRNAAGLYVQGNTRTTNSEKVNRLQHVSVLTSRPLRPSPDHPSLLPSVGVSGPSGSLQLANLHHGKKSAGVRDIITY